MPLSCVRVEAVVVVVVVVLRVLLLVGVVEVVGVVLRGDGAEGGMKRTPSMPPHT